MNKKTLESIVIRKTVNGFTVQNYSNSSEIYVAETKENLFKVISKLFGLSTPK